MELFSFPRKQHHTAVRYYYDCWYSLIVLSPKELIYLDSILLAGNALIRWQPDKSEICIDFHFHLSICFVCSGICTLINYIMVFFFSSRNSANKTELKMWKIECCFHINYAARITNRFAVLNAWAKRALFSVTMRTANEYNQCNAAIAIA